MPVGLRGEPDISQFVRVSISSCQKGDTSKSKGKVAVIECVNAPQFIEFRVGMSILDAVEAAGGFSRNANKNEFRVYNYETGITTYYRGMKPDSDSWRAFYSRILLKETEVLEVLTCGI